MKSALTRNASLNSAGCLVMNMPQPMVVASHLCASMVSESDRKSTRLNSSHDQISYAVFCLKKKDMDLAAKGLGAKEWNNSLKTKLSLLPKKLFRIRMSRNFGMKMLTMTNLSTECLIQLTKLGYDATPFNQILKQNAKREMRLRLGKVTVADVLAVFFLTTKLPKIMPPSPKMILLS